MDETDDIDIAYPAEDDDADLPDTDKADDEEDENEYLTELDI